MPTILTNFGPGFGPFVRTLDMARQISPILERTAQEQVFILVPYVYGADQLRIVKEQTLIDPDLNQRIRFSPDLGECLKPLLFSDGDFNNYASQYLACYSRHQAQWNTLLSNRLSVIDIQGTSSTIAHESLALELSRNPVLNSPIRFSYFTAIESLASIFEATLGEPQGFDGIDLGIIEKTLPLLDDMERGFRLHFLPTIRTLTWRRNSTHRFRDERYTPPLIPAPTNSLEPLRNGVYVSQSGITGLESLYDEALALPDRVYSNRISKSIPTDHVVPPSVIANPGIKVAYARAAWNSIWLANLTSTPLICPTYACGDHPEIFFNIRTVEQLGLAAVWNRGLQPLVQFLETLDTEDLLYKQRELYDGVSSEFGTLDGIEYCCAQLVEDYLNGC